MSVRTDPTTAPKRDDLPFLRRRVRPTKPPAQAGSAAGSAGSRPRGTIDYTRSDRRPAPPAAASPSTPSSAPSSSGSLDLSTPSGGAGIDYTRRDRTPAAPTTTPPPTTPPPARPAPAGGSSSLDLSGAGSAGGASSGGGIDYSRRDRAPAPASPNTPPPTNTLPPAGGGLLDLSPDAAPTPERRPAPPAARTNRPPDTRVGPGQRLLLSVDDPTVTLRRVQSGIGALTIEAACSDEVGDLRLGAAYQLSTGESSTVQLTGGRRFAPTARRPVIIASHDRFERLQVDLRQSRTLERLAVYAFSESRSPLTWGGTLIVTTFGGSEIEIPLDQISDAPVAVLMTLYNVRGEFVLRSELQPVDGDIRDACRAFGYDRISWVDARTPID